MIILSKILGLRIVTTFTRINVKLTVRVTNILRNPLKIFYIDIGALAVMSLLFTVVKFIL